LAANWPSRWARDGSEFWFAIGRRAAGLDRRVRMGFQRRAGRAEWLKPYTDKTLADLPGQGVRRLAVISPGFSADNLETLEEIALQGRETFLEAGGEAFAYLSCLNADAPGLKMLANLLARELAGWVSAS